MPAIYNGSFLKPELLSFGISEEALYPADWSEVIYTVIDVASVVAAFYGLDVVPELFGFCYAAYRGDVLRMGVYGAAAIVPMSNAFTPGKLAKYGKILKNGVWRAHPQALIDEMANRFGLINNRVAGMIQAADGLARRRAVKLMLREDLVDELMLLPSPDVRVKFLEDFLDLSPRGNNFAQHILGKPRLVKAWGVMPQSLRTDVANLEKVISYEATRAGSLPSIQVEFANLASDRHQNFINGLGNVANNDLLSNSLTLNRIPDVAEISSATNRIKQHRIDVGIPEDKNFGYVEGNFNGGSITFPNSSVVSSGPPVPENQRIFEAAEVGGWERYTDSEYKMLNQLARDLGATPGGNNVNPAVSGTLKIVSERPYCKSCQGVIQQFNQLFPNIEITLIDGVR